MSKRDKIQSWLLENLNFALRSKGLRQVEIVPWTSLAKGVIQRHKIVIKGWPSEIVPKRLLQKKDCDTLLSLMQGKILELQLHALHTPIEIDTMEIPSNSLITRTTSP